MTNKGLFFDIEGSDSSGKKTQTDKLLNRLISEGCDTRKLSFPNYESTPGKSVIMYLEGEFGENPEEVDPYPASQLYAIDRWASYKKEWGVLYNNGTTFISDRYCGSNAIHQAVKLQGEEKGKFLEWLYDLEYNKNKIPVPDCVIFLDMPPEISEELMKDRANKFSGEEKKDIHERNPEFLRKSYENAVYVAEKYGWIRIRCFENGRLKTEEEIHEEVYNNIKPFLIK